MRAGGLLVAVYAAAWLLLSSRGARVVATECTIIGRPADECALEHRGEGEAYQTPWQNCRRGPWAERARAIEAPPTELRPRRPWPAGLHLPCFYYVNDPAAIFLEPRAHPWATPLPLALLGLGSLAAIFASVAARLPRPSRPGVAPPDAGPYRRMVRPPREPPPPLEPLSIVLLETHWSSLIFGGPLLFLGAILFLLALSLGLTSGGSLYPFFVFAMSVAHGSVFLGAVIALSRGGLELTPEGSLFVRWRSVGPFFLRRAYDLADVVGITQSSERVARTQAYFLRVERRAGLPLLRWRVTSADEAQRYVEAIEAFLLAWRQREASGGEHGP